MTRTILFAGFFSMFCLGFGVGWYRDTGTEAVERCATCLPAEGPLVLRMTCRSTIGESSTWAKVIPLPTGGWSWNMPPWVGDKGVCHFVLESTP
jgi:hypothetical protein